MGNPLARAIKQSGMEGRKRKGPAWHCTIIVAVVEPCHFLTMEIVPKAGKLWKEGVDDKAITMKRISVISADVPPTPAPESLQERGLHLSMRGVTSTGSRDLPQQESIFIFI